MDIIYVFILRGKKNNVFFLLLQLVCMQIFVPSVELPDSVSLAGNCWLEGGTLHFYIRSEVEILEKLKVEN